MNYLLDIIGASVIGGMVILLIIGLNMQMTSSSNEVVQNTYTQMSAVNSNQIIEYDFYKVGYRVTGDKILTADSNSIKYCTVFNDTTGAVDTVDYYLGLTDSVSLTNNPNDKPLFRKINDTDSMMVSVVTNFRLVYYDVLGSQISYAVLGTQSARDSVRSIQINVMTESADATKGAYSETEYYQGAEWGRVIRPKNLN